MVNQNAQSHDEPALTGPVEAIVTLPSPFYECDDAVIYCGDAFELLPLIEANACITDPPYGINYKSGHNTGYVNKREGWDDWRRDSNFAPIAGDDKPFDPSPLLRFDRVAICGANFFASRLPDSRCWITWDKREDSGSDRQSDCEFIWTNFPKPSRVFRHLWRGLCRRGEENVAKAAKQHPHQKPVALMRWLMEYGEAGPVVVDPFMGSGSTLLASRDNGLRSIGIELSEEYCEAAARRLRNRSRSLLVE
jgi:site-specific DNA-methyltransferase (adenine-specific)